MRVHAQARYKGYVRESAVTVVVIEVRGVVGEIGLKDIEPTVAVIVSHTHAHPGLFLPVLVVSVSRHDSDVFERPIVFVMKKDAGLGINRHVDVGPAVVVEIVGDGGNRITRPGLQDAGLLRYIGERPIAIVMVKDIHAARQAARPAHHRNALPLAVARLSGHRHLLQIEFDVVAHKQVQESVAVVIDPSTAGAPADALFP